MYEEVTSDSNSFTMQSASNGSLSSAGRYGNGYYSDPSVSLLSGASASYSDMLLQPSTVCYAPSYTTDGSSGADSKQLYYQQEGSYSQQEQSLPSSTCYVEAGQSGGLHPGRATQTPSTSSAAAAAAVAEATAALRLATSYSMFAVKPAQPAPGTLSLRGPTADRFAAADRLAADAAAAAADFAPTSASGPSAGYGASGLSKITASAAAPTAFHLSNESTGDGSTSFHGGFHGFHPAANGFLSTAGSSAGAYNPFQKLQTPWTTSRMAMDAYSSLDVCKFSM